MAKSAQQLRLERLLASSEANVRAAFQQFVNGATSEAAMKRAADALERGDINGAMDVVNAYIRQFGAANAQNIVRLGALESHVLDAAIGAVGIAFDPSHPRAAELIRSRTLDLVREMTTEQEAAIQQALGRAFMEGEGLRGAARAFRGAIGLTKRMEGAVENYRRLLATGSAEALDRELRDRRFDRTVARSIRTGTPLGDAEIDRMVERYRERYLAYRSENIARTESVRTLSEASLEATRQMQEQAGIPDDRITRVWHATNDKRTRESHREMNGQERGINEAFESGEGNLLRYPGDPNAPANDTINCRCTVTTRIKEPQASTVTAA